MFGTSYDTKCEIERKDETIRQLKLQLEREKLRYENLQYQHDKLDEEVDEIAETRFLQKAAKFEQQYYHDMHTNLEERADRADDRFNSIMEKMVDFMDGITSSNDVHVVGIGGEVHKGK